MQQQDSFSDLYLTLGQFGQPTWNFSVGHISLYLNSVFDETFILVFCYVSNLLDKIKIVV